VRVLLRGPVLPGWPAAHPGRHTLADAEAGSIDSAAPALEERQRGLADWIRTTPNSAGFPHRSIPRPSRGRLATGKPKPPCRAGRAPGARVHDLRHRPPLRVDRRGPLPRRDRGGRTASRKGADDGRRRRLRPLERRARRASARRCLSAAGSRDAGLEELSQFLPSSASTASPRRAATGSPPPKIAALSAPRAHAIDQTPSHEFSWAIWASATRWQSSLPRRAHQTTHL
jgi:hypothetical protein